MSQWEIEFYQLTDGSSPVLIWFREQKPKVQAKFTHIFDLLAEYGTLVGMPYVRPLKNTKLFERKSDSPQSQPQADWGRIAILVFCNFR